MSSSRSTASEAVGTPRPLVPGRTDGWQRRPSIGWKRNRLPLPVSPGERVSEGLFPPLPTARQGRESAPRPYFDLLSTAFGCGGFRTHPLTSLRNPLTRERRNSVRATLETRRWEPICAPRHGRALARAESGSDTLRGSAPSRQSFASAGPAMRGFGVRKQQEALSASSRVYCRHFADSLLPSSCLKLGRAVPRGNSFSKRGGL